MKGILAFLFCLAVVQYPDPGSTSPFLCDETLAANAAAATAAAQGRGTPLPPGPFCPTIDGAVVRSGSNSAIPFAELTLLRPNSGPAGDALTIRADSNGRFAFPPLNPTILPMGYNIEVAAEGYVPMLYGQLDANGPGEFIPLRLRDHLSLTIKLTSNPAIGGMVSTASAEPLAGALVRAYRIAYTPISRRFKIVAKEFTNDHGAYRLLGLAAGDYYVSASFNEEARAVPMPGTLLTPNLSNPDLGFVTTFFPSVISPQDALGFTVFPSGARNDQNITLKDTERFKLHVSVAENFASSMDTHNFNIALLPAGADLGDVEDYSVKESSRTGFDIQNIARGRYSLVAFDRGRILSEASHMDIQRDQSVSISTYDPVDLPGTIVNEAGDPVSIYPIYSGTCQTYCVVIDGSNSKPAKMRVRLVRTDAELAQTIYADVDSGRFSVPNIGPGDYDVYIEGLLYGTYISTVEFRNPDSNRFGRIRIEPDKPPRMLDPATGRWQIPSGIRIVVSAAKSIVTGTVWTGAKRDGEPVPVPGALIVFVPDRRPDNPLLFREDRFLTAHANAKGKFSSALPSGSYTAFGFEQIPDNLFFDPQFLERIAGLGLPINVRPLEVNSPVSTEVLRMSECEGDFVDLSRALDRSQCLLRVPREQSQGLDR